MESDFFDFVLQRQSIWYKRFALGQEAPWTPDSVLQQYKILNVYRELDKGTRYILDKLKGMKDRKAILLNIVFYRFFNRFDLYENLGIKPFHSVDNNLMNDLKAKLGKLKEQGKPIFNDAYLIAGKKGEQKYSSVLNSLSWLNENADDIINRVDNTKTPEDSFKIIKEIPLVGNFLAYEIWTDLTYFGFFRQGWTDNDFVNIGPGASWGLKIIYGKLTKKEETERLKHLYEIQNQFLNNKKWLEIHNKNAFSNKPFLSLRNLEHGLCEFRKYSNLKNGKGKKRFYLTSFSVLRLLGLGKKRQTQKI